MKARRYVQVHVRKKIDAFGNCVARFVRAWVGFEMICVVRDVRLLKEDGI